MIINYLISASPGSLKVNSLQLFRLALGVISMCWGAAGFSQAPHEMCISAGTLSAQTQVLASQSGSISRSDIALEALLFSRELLSEPDSYWLGFQLVGTSITNGEDASAPLFYSVPFAIQINRNSGAWLSQIINAKLKADDSDSLLAIYKALHSLPSALLSPGEARIVTETDSVGSVLVRYESPISGQVIRSRERYQSYGTAEGNGLIESAEIKEDVAKIIELRCAMKDFEGRSKVSVYLTGDMSFLTDQTTRLQPIKDAVIPSDLMLATLDHDPRRWTPIDITAIYPPEKRQPLASSEQFLEQLSALDLADIDTDSLRALLFNNDEFLLAIKQELGASGFSQDFEEELLLQIGLANSQKARQLLTEVIADDLFETKTRFGGIMGLKYTTDALEPEAKAALLDFSALSNLSPSDQQLADSTLMVLGIIARKTDDSGLESMLVDRVNSGGDERRVMVAMTALGNAGSQSGAQVLGDFLTSKSPALSARAAASLGQIKSDTAKSLLTARLQRESRPDVLGSVIASLGESNLTVTEIVQLQAKTSTSEALVVRRAAVEAISKQAAHLPEAKAALKDLMTETTDRQSLKHIMSGLYGGD
jgi:hypothetical protein